jgi:hypothetical protein
MRAFPVLLILLAWGSYSWGGSGYAPPPVTVGAIGGQPVDAALTSLSTVCAGADSIPYCSGADAFTAVSFTTTGRAVASAANAAAVRTAAGVGTISTAASGDYLLVAGEAVTAAALAANGGNCAGDQFALGVSASGVAECAQPAFSNLSGAAVDAQVPDNITVDLATSATTATALAANPADCAAGEYATTIAASGALTCAAVAFSQVTGSVTDGQVPDTITVDLASTATALAANPADCAAGEYAASIAASGALTCAVVAFSQLSGAAVDGQVPNNITVDLAATATALASNPSDCGASQYATAIAASGNLTCAQPAASGVAYTPAEGANWEDPDPTTTAGALDAVADATSIAAALAASALLTAGNAITGLEDGSGVTDAAAWRAAIGLNASVVPYTPAVGADWGTDPDDSAEALDQLALRLTDVEGAGGGTIGGATGASDNRIIRSDGMGGATIQSSNAELTDGGALSGITDISLTGTVDGVDVSAIPATYQPLDATLTAVAGWEWTSGTEIRTLVAADTFSTRRIGASADNILALDADARYPTGDGRNLTYGCTWDLDWNAERDGLAASNGWTNGGTGGTHTLEDDAQGIAREKITYGAAVTGWIEYTSTVAANAAAFELEIDWIPAIETLGSNIRWDGDSDTSDKRVSVNQDDMLTTGGPVGQRQVVTIQKKAGLVGGVILTVDGRYSQQIDYSALEASASATPRYLVGKNTTTGTATNYIYAVRAKHTGWCNSPPAIRNSTDLVGVP